MMKGMFGNRGVVLAALAASGVVLAPQVRASTVALQNAAADYWQSSGGLNITQAIDGITTGSLNGWAVDPQEGLSHWAAFETTADIGFAGGSILTFTLYQGLPLSIRDPPDDHQLGRFALSVTTDPRGAFSTWTVLDPATYIAANGATLTEQGDNSLLVSMPPPPTSETTYTVTAITFLTGITGIRLQAITDPTLPHNGPGTCSVNGNFVLEEIQVDVQNVPEPGVGLLMLLGMAGFVVRQRLCRRPTG